jgi:hypothetical protein
MMCRFYPREVYNARQISIEVEGANRREYFVVIRYTLGAIHADFQKLPRK